MTQRRSALPARRRALTISLTRLRHDLVYGAMDFTLAILALTTMMVIRYEGRLDEFVWRHYIWVAPLYASLFVAMQALHGSYGHMWRYVSVSEAMRILRAGMWSLAVATLIFATTGLLPLSAVIVASVLTTMLVGLGRFQTRLFSFARQARTPDETEAVRTLFIGVGDQTDHLIRKVQDGHRGADGRSIAVVGVVDPDGTTSARKLKDVPVISGLDGLEQELRQHAIDQVICTHVTGVQANRIESVCERTGTLMRMAPSDSNLMASDVQLQHVRDVRIDDLLGREPIGTNLDQVRALLQGKRVLITGAGGSIGSEIARQVHRFDPAQLVILDNDETHLHAVEADLVHFTPELADIRHQERLRNVFARHRPEVIFHAAAHKHVPILESCPAEAVFTNIIGTRNLIALSEEFDVERFVLISTDKAVAPSSVMGASKRCAEQLVLATAQRNGKPWCAVRFGNVLGSRGSVIPTFTKQIEQGGPITITDARMTRFFMTIPEAVQLVLQSATLAAGSEVFMLDMGEPVKIMDLARRMIRLSGKRPGTDIEIRVVGIRPGEKLHEVLAEETDLASPTSHASITRLRPDVAALQPIHDLVQRWHAMSLAEQNDALRRELLMGVNTLVQEHISTGVANGAGNLEPLGRGSDANPIVSTSINVSVHEQHDRHQQ